MEEGATGCLNPPAPRTLHQQGMAWAGSHPSTSAQELGCGTQSSGPGEAPSPQVPSSTEGARGPPQAPGQHEHWECGQVVLLPASEAPGMASFPSSRRCLL